MISKAIISLEGLISLKTEQISKTFFVVTIFANNDLALAACEINITHGTEAQNKLKPINSLDPILKKENSIRVWDIPLNTKLYEVQHAFTKFGQISSISMSTQAMWQSAIIEYKDIKGKQAVLTKWTVPIKCDLVRVFDALQDMTQMFEQLQFSAKLTNLPVTILI